MEVHTEKWARGIRNIEIFIIAAAAAVGIWWSPQRLCICIIIIIILEKGMRCKPFFGVTSPPKVLKVGLYIYELYTYIRRSIRTTDAAAGLR